MELNLSHNQLSSFNWKDCPTSVTIVNLTNNKLSSFNWVGCPNSVTTVYLHDNQLSSFNWVGCPTSVTTVYLSYNQLSSFNWVGCPISVTSVYLYDNKIIEYTIKEKPINCKVYGEPDIKKQIKEIILLPEEKECAICYLTEEYTEFVELDCKHIYHKECYIKLNQNKCPYCNQ